MFWPGLREHLWAGRHPTGDLGATGGLLWSEDRPTAQQSKWNQWQGERGVPDQQQERLVQEIGLGECPIEVNAERHLLAQGEFIGHR